MENRDIYKDYNFGRGHIKFSNFDGGITNFTSLDGDINNGLVI
jgi:hypothetical protein